MAHNGTETRARKLKLDHHYARIMTSGGWLRKQAMRPVAILWILLSTAVASLTTLSFIEPYWFISGRTRSSLGVISYCTSDMTTKGNFVHQCHVYGSTFDFSKLPSNAWQAACVMYGGGSLLLCVSACTGLVTLCLPSSWDRRLSVVTGYVQGTAVVMMAAGLAIYPLGLNTKFVRYYCAGAGKYWAGDCQIGWAYLLAIVSTAIAAFTPFLAQYTDVQLRDRAPSPRASDYALKPYMGCV